MEDFKIYENHKHKFSLKYFSDWYVRANNDDLVVFLPKENFNKNEFITNINIVVKKLNNEESLDNLLKRTTADLKKLVRYFTLEESVKININNLKVYKVIYSGDIGKYTNIKWQLITFLKNGYEFSLTYSSKREDYQKNLYKFEDCINSFEFCFDKK